mgnify:CR=1 FL=1
MTDINSDASKITIVGEFQSFKEKSDLTLISVCKEPEELPSNVEVELYETICRTIFHQLSAHMSETGIYNMVMQILDEEKLS